jgi:FkbM family methyltransferase
MIFSSLRNRFARTPNWWLHEAPECVMHVHAAEAERHIDYSICHEVQALDCYRVHELVASGFAPRVIVDIGAHIGTFTAMAAKYFPDATIYSFEPLRHHYDLLVKNSPPRRGRPQNLAIVGFYSNEEGHDVYAGTEFELAYRSRQLSNAISVSDFFRKYKLKTIDLLKIDCEQAEVNIFRELDELDRLRDIEVIVGEWHFATAKKELQSIVGKTHDVQIVDDGMWNHFFARRRP